MEASSGLWGAETPGGCESLQKIFPVGHRWGFSSPGTYMLDFRGRDNYICDLRKNIYVRGRSTPRRFSSYSGSECFRAAPRQKSAGSLAGRRAGSFGGEGGIVKNWVWGRLKALRAKCSRRRMISGLRSGYRWVQMPLLKPRLRELDVNLCEKWQ